MVEAFFSTNENRNEEPVIPQDVEKLKRATHDVLDKIFESHIFEGWVSALPDYQPGEARSYDDPGEDSYVDIYRITHGMKSDSFTIPIQKVKIGVIKLLTGTKEDPASLVERNVFLAVLQQQLHLFDNEGLISIMYEVEDVAEREYQFWDLPQRITISRDEIRIQLLFNWQKALDKSFIKSDVFDDELTKLYEQTN
jgi:hypothetical protein